MRPSARVIEFQSSRSTARRDTSSRRWPPDQSWTRFATWSSPSRKVFQYLGLVSRPAQIALTGLASRVMYDFRDGTVSINRDEPRHPDELTASERADFLKLIHTWERMVLARARSTP